MATTTIDIPDDLLVQRGRGVAGRLARRPRSLERGDERREFLLDTREIRLERRIGDMGRKRNGARSQRGAYEQRQRHDTEDNDGNCALHPAELT